uniref:Uncharacterized protein n=1 Tax=Phlebotomus papatasi TaxID=29031 RepID=A0A1B0DEK4_PHLPP
MTSVKQIKVTPIESISSKIELKPVQKPEKSVHPVRWLIRRFKYFCRVTALHGFGHIVREDTGLAEKIFWAICTFASHITAMVLLWFSWNWSNLTPVVTVIESTHYATWNIPFPAVTICNLNKISLKRALAKANNMKRPENVSAEELAQMFQDLTIFMGYTHESMGNFNQIDSVLHMNNLTVFEVLQDLAPGCSETLDRCMWKGTQTRCDTLFQPVNSTLGVCCFI